MRKLLALFATCLLTLAAHAQQDAGMRLRLRPAASALPARGTGFDCIACAKLGPGERGAAGSNAPAAGASSVCSQRGGARPNWPFFGGLPASNPTESDEYLRFDPTRIWAGTVFWPHPATDAPVADFADKTPAGQPDSGAFNSARPAFTFFSNRAAAYGCAATPFGAGMFGPLLQSSGTVNSGTAGTFAYYATSGSAVSENPRLAEASGSTLNYTGSGGLDLTGGSSDSGQLQLSGATSGTVTLSVADAAGTYTFKLPASAGTSGQVLATDGSGATSWTTTINGVPAFDTLTSGSTVTWTFSGAERRKANLTLGTNASLSLSGAVSGSEGDLYVKQDATGGRTLTLPANSYLSNGGTLSLSTAPNAIDKLHFAYDGTRYYWDAPVTNYTAVAGPPRSLILDGVNDYGVNTDTGTSVPSSQTGWRFMARLRDLVPNGSTTLYLFRDTGGAVLTLRLDAGGTHGILGAFVGTGGDYTSYVSLPSDDVIVLVRSDPANSAVSIEAWNLDGTGRVGSINSSASTSATNFQNRNIAFGAFNGGSLFFEGKVDKALFITGAGSYNSTAPNVNSTTGDIFNWTFDGDDGTDSTGHANLTFSGSPAFENTP